MFASDWSGRLWFIHKVLQAVWVPWQLQGSDMNAGMETNSWPALTHTQTTQGPSIYLLTAFCENVAVTSLRLSLCLRCSSRVKSVLTSGSQTNNLQSDLIYRGHCQEAVRRDLFHDKSAPKTASDIITVQGKYTDDYANKFLTFCVRNLFRKRRFSFDLNAWLYFLQPILVSVLKVEVSQVIVRNDVCALSGALLCKQFNCPVYSTLLRWVQRICSAAGDRLDSARRNTPLFVLHSDWFCCSWQKINHLNVFLLSLKWKQLLSCQQAKTCSNVKKPQKTIPW